MDQEFWVMEAPTQGDVRADWDESVDFEQVKCSLNPAHQRAGKRLSNLRVILPFTAVPDLVWTWYGECLIQDRVLQIFRREGFTGFSVKPVQVTFGRVESGEAVPTLWELIALGWGGVAQPGSGVSLNEDKCCAACGHLVYTPCQDPSRLVDQLQWDGSDFLMVWPLPRFIFLTKRVVDCVRKHGFSNVQLTPVQDLRFGTPTTRDHGFAPGRLSYWMPEARARELGERLGIF